MAMATPAGNMAVQSLHVVSEVQCRFATTEIVTRMKNVDPNGAHEAEFVVQLPGGAFITYFEM